ncbi:DNA-binding protein YbiB [Ottowia sp.]|uniref:DNA-binding protein YbiB n=1 Tax=Ottowia sp. TaxID=1898956 RepID=UPI003A87538A
MAISAYLKDIARGSAGARHLSRAQAADLLGQVLDGACTDLEIGAFCIAMRVKGETPDELAGFLDALHVRLHLLPRSDRPVVVLPSYNGARKLPVLTPLLGLMLARKGLPVLIHGSPTEDGRTTSQQVLAQLGLPVHCADEPIANSPIANGQLHFVPTEALHPGLQRLLAVRCTLGVRNTAHSLVKLMNPVDGPALVIGSYTHPEYLESMTATFQRTGARALLLRGTEGEPVADPRRTPRMDLFLHGQVELVQPAQSGPLTTLPHLPGQIGAEATARYIQAVLAGELPVPDSLLLQAEHILRACKLIEAEGDTSSLMALAQ